MEQIVLKPKKSSFLDKIKKLFEDKKKRYIYVVLFVLPFLIVIAFFSVVAIKETKSIIELATGTTEVKNENKIESMNYVLRENATEIQKEYFLELKNAIENDNAPDEEIAGLICKNYIADMYTWTNKQGQYDVSAIYYLYTGETEKGDFDEVTYVQARDGFYKYINNYINEYGAKNLLEVENVEVIKAQKAPYEYQVKEVVGYDSVDSESSVEVFGYVGYEAYDVSCKWTYKQSTKFDTSKFATSQNFLVILREGRYEIVEASENPIDARIEINEEEQNDVTQEALIEESGEQDVTTE